MDSSSDLGQPVRYSLDRVCQNPSLHCRRCRAVSAIGRIWVEVATCDWWELWAHSRVNAHHAPMPSRQGAREWAVMGDQVRRCYVSADGCHERGNETGWAAVDSGSIL